MLKYLRIAVTALSLTACVLLIALWGRSYWHWDNWQGRISSDESLHVQSFGGQIAVFKLPHAMPWKVGSIQPPDWRKAIRKRPIFGSTWRSRGSVQHHDGELIGHIRHWHLAIPLSAFIVLPWLPWRFSLRTLLIATTLVAVGLGVIIYLAR
jgi:hypothetical protein